MRTTFFLVMGFVLSLETAQAPAHSFSENFQSSFEIARKSKKGSWSNTVLFHRHDLSSMDLLSDEMRASPPSEVLKVLAEPSRKRARLEDTEFEELKFSLESSFFQEHNASSLEPPHEFFLNKQSSRDATEEQAKDESLLTMGEISQCQRESSEKRSSSRPYNALLENDHNAFGVLLASAAREQIDDFVVYNDSYSEISYPQGDVHPMYGVCTDVVIRAYRALGVDLQELVHLTKSGARDRNIDHRRVLGLKNFFSRYGENLPITALAENYSAGDIIIYYRPQNQNSKYHIALVSDQKGLSGRPMILHNRGWGPQEEDDLFLSEIIGHYRFSALKRQLTTRTSRPRVASLKVLARKTKEARQQIISIRLSRSFLSGSTARPLLAKK